MNTLTKEWLQNTITGIESIIDDKSFVCSEIAFEIGQVNNILTAFKIALASLAAVSDERAAYELFMEKRFGESVDRRRAKNGDREYMAWDMALGWIIWCHRAAMLQGADGKPELTVCYGSMPETNGKTNWTAMLHRKGQHPWEGITIERSEYPDRVRYESDRMRHLIGELSEEPDILEYDSDAHSGYVKPGNSPVIPDGWKLVPIDPTKDMLRAGQSVVGFWLNTVHCYSKMLAAAPAAPQQEVKL